MIPLYATEDEIAALVFGRGRLREWRAFATIQERHGLPPTHTQVATSRRYRRAGAEQTSRVAKLRVLNRGKE